MPHCACDYLGEDRSVQARQFLWRTAGAAPGWALLAGSRVPGALTASSRSQGSCTACLTSWTQWGAAFRRWACSHRYAAWLSPCCSSTMHTATALAAAAAGVVRALRLPLGCTAEALQKLTPSAPHAGAQSHPPMYAQPQSACALSSLQSGCKAPSVLVPMHTCIAGAIAHGASKGRKCLCHNVAIASLVAQRASGAQHRHVYCSDFPSLPLLLAGPCWWTGSAVLVHDLHSVRHSRQGWLPGFL